MNTTDPAQQTKMHDLVSKFETAMLVTHSGGKLRARPMAVAKVEQNCTVWFLTMHESGKVHEIETDPSVSITLQKDREIFVSLTGQASLHRDRAKVDELWTESYKVWFPKGKDDPDLAIIRVEAEEGEYWDQQGTKKIQYLFQAAKAYATGTRPKIEEGEQHAKVGL